MPPFVSSSGSSSFASSSALRSVSSLCDFADRPSFLIGLLRDRRALLVADHGIQRGDEDRVALERVGEPLLVHLEARDRLIGERARRVREQLDALQQVSAITGSITLSWKLPDWPAIVIVASLPMTCAATIVDRLGDHRIDLARHDAAARLQRRQRDLAEARERAAVHPAQVVRDLHQAHGRRLRAARTARPPCPASSSPRRSCRASGSRRPCASRARPRTSRRTPDAR